MTGQDTKSNKEYLESLSTESKAINTSCLESNLIKSDSHNNNTKSKNDRNIVSNMTDTHNIGTHSTEALQNLESNTIYIADVFSFLESLPNSSIDLSIIDPPYNLKVASWDRFKNEKDRLQCLSNINAFHKRYDYCVGVQMILTQYVIDLWKENKFEVHKFENEFIPGNIISFLYPHPIHTGLKLTDFNFKRNDFFHFLQYLKKDCYSTYVSFILSTINSCKFKYTGLKEKEIVTECSQPILSDGKEILNTCGHSILYKCYSDCDNCILCDLKTIFNDI